MSADLLVATGVRAPGTRKGNDMTRRTCRTAALAALLLPLAACEWFTDFKRTPKVDTWEAYTYDSIRLHRGQPQLSVPTTGSAAPGYRWSYQPMIGTLDSMSVIPNPTAPSAASLENGRKYYQINCAVCHGPAGKGNGSATRFGVIPFPLTTATTVGRTDGYIFAMIRNGRGSMPSYNRIEESDRWDVVNYVRALQGQVPGAAVDTLPPALPGITGTAVPGPTVLGPNVPSVHRAVPGGTPQDSIAARDTSASRPAPSAGASTAAPSDTSRQRTPEAQP